MSPVYQIADRKGSRALSQYLAQNGQLLLPMVELVSSAQLAVEEFMGVLGRAALEAVLELSAQQVAGPRHQGQPGGEVRRHGTQGGVSPVVPDATTTGPSAHAHLGSLRRTAGALAPADAEDHSPLATRGSPPGVTFKRSRVRKSRTLGSVRAKAEWLSYSTILSVRAKRATLLVAGKNRVSRRRGSRERVAHMSVSQVIPEVLPEAVAESVLGFSIFVDLVYIASLPMRRKHMNSGVRGIPHMVWPIMINAAMRLSALARDTGGIACHRRAT